MVYPAGINRADEDPRWINHSREESYGHLLAAFNKSDRHLTEIQSEKKNKIKIYFEYWDHHLLHKRLFQSVWLQDSQTEIHYLYNAIYILFSEISLYFSNSNMSDLIVQWMNRQYWSQELQIFCLTCKNLDWLLMLSWKKHRSAPNDHHYMILTASHSTSPNNFSSYTWVLSLHSKFSS